MKRIHTALLIVASSAATFAALVPVRRTLSKIDPKALDVLQGAFWRESVFCLLIGAGAIFLGIEVQRKSPMIGWMIVLLSPLLVLIANLLLLLALPQG